MAKVLGIFTCYNRKEKTVRCLESLLLGCPNIDFSFIAVDDNSVDGTKEALEAYENVKIVFGDGQSYYSGGMRLGIEAGEEFCDNFDWILFLNDDVEFFPCAIERLAAFAVGREEILVGATCDENERLTYGGIVKRSRFKPSFQIVMSQESRRYCDTFNGNCVLLPTEIFRALPNIDDRYTHSMGDLDYGLEASKRGIPIAASDFFVGKCCDNSTEGTWRDVRLSRKQRLVRKETPKGLPWREWFYFIEKHYGFLGACYGTLSPFVRILLGK